MATSEERNLEQLYRNMLDGELEALAAEAYALTDVARPLLRAEIAKRGLGFELRESAEPAKKKAVPLKKGEALVVIGKVWDAAGAGRAKEILDRINVPSYFGPENVPDVDEALETFDEGAYPEGFDLKVKELDVDAAAMALALAPPAASVSLPDEGVSVKCPQCASEEVIFEGLEGEESDPGATYRWVCDACGHQWEDDGLGA